MCKSTPLFAFFFFFGMSLLKDSYCTQQGFPRCSSGAAVNGKCRSYTQGRSTQALQWWEEGSCHSVRGKKAEHVCAVLIHTTLKGHQRPKRPQQMEVIQRKQCRMRKSHFQRTYSGSEVGRRRELRDSGKTAIQTDSHTETPANVGCGH